MATVCYVYLSDVTDANSIDGEESQFRKARWHSRGWTLQELLAPHNVNFYNQDWNLIGTKSTLRAQLAEITRIDVKILSGEISISTACVAQRMSWASQRETSRLEDMAYCLMGIFSVNMTILYGEGTNAFIRLQEEICRESNDNSIFAWQKVADGQIGHGLLAEHPCYFRDSCAISSADGGDGDPFLAFTTHKPITMVSQRIQMESYLLTMRPSSPEVLILVLGCRVLGRSNLCDSGNLGILIQKRWLPGLGFLYVRIHSDFITRTRDRPDSTQTIMLAKTGAFSDGAYV